MLLTADNRSLINRRERTFLTAAPAVGATTLTLRAVDTNAWADNDWVLVGELGTKNAEILQLNGAVADGAALTVDNAGAGGARYAHSVGDPVYRLDYNRVEFNRTATDTTTGTTVLATNEIQPDELYTRYEDTTNTTGFGFVRWNNSLSAAFSSYSDGVPYTGYTTRSLFRMREKVRRLVREKERALQDFISDEDIRQELNNMQRAISQERLWPFYERTKSFAGVANQWRYTVNDDVSKLYYALYDSQPLAVIDKKRFNILNWDTTTTGDPTHCVVWKDEDVVGRIFLNVYPKTNAAADTDAINDVAGITATATTITVDSTSGFRAQGRIIIESEVIEYDATTATTFTGCRRGAEGTTAATHADDTAVTERDFIYHYHADPTDLVDTNDISHIPDPDVLVYGAAAELALQQDRGDLHDRLFAKYTNKLEKLRENFSNVHTGGPLRVKKVEEIVVDDAINVDPNRYLTGGVTGSA